MLFVNEITKCCVSPPNHGDTAREFNQGGACRRTFKYSRMKVNDILKIDSITKKQHNLPDFSSGWVYLEDGGIGKCLCDSELDRTICLYLSKGRHGLFDAIYFAGIDTQILTQAIILTLNQIFILIIIHVLFLDNVNDTNPNPETSSDSGILKNKSMRYCIVLLVFMRTNLSCLPPVVGARMRRDKTMTNMWLCHRNKDGGGCLK